MLLHWGWIPFAMCFGCVLGMAIAALCQAAKQADAASEQDQRPPVVTIPKPLLNDVLDELYELRGDRQWWKDDHRTRYQDNWHALCAEIEQVEALCQRIAPYG